MELASSGDTSGQGGAGPGRLRLLGTVTDSYLLRAVATPGSSVLIPRDGHSPQRQVSFPSWDRGGAGPRGGPGPACHLGRTVLSPPALSLSDDGCWERQGVGLGWLGTWFQEGIWAAGSPRLTCCRTPGLPSCRLGSRGHLRFVGSSAMGRGRCRSVLRLTLIRPPGGRRNFHLFSD